MVTKKTNYKQSRVFPWSLQRACNNSWYRGWGCLFSGQLGAPWWFCCRPGGHSSPELSPAVQGNPSPSSSWPHEQPGVLFGFSSPPMPYRFVGHVGNRALPPPCPPLSPPPSCSCCMVSPFSPPPSHVLCGQPPLPPAALISWLWLI